MFAAGLCRVSGRQARIGYHQARETIGMRSRSTQPNDTAPIVHNQRNLPQDTRSNEYTHYLASFVLGCILYRPVGVYGETRMGLSPGTQLGTFQITGFLGEGGRSRVPRGACGATISDTTAR